MSAMLFLALNSAKTSDIGCKRIGLSRIGPLT